MTKTNVFPWIKVYSDCLEDPTLRTLSHDQFGFYIRLIVLAFRSDAEGALIKRESGKPLLISEIALLLRTDEKKTIEQLERLKTSDLLRKEKNNTWMITRYLEEQINQEEKRNLWRTNKAAQRAKYSNSELSSGTPRRSSRGV